MASSIKETGKTINSMEEEFMPQLTAHIKDNSNKE